MIHVALDLRKNNLEIRKYLAFGKSRICCE